MRDYYLQQMGITPWVLRPTPQPSCSQTLDILQQTVSACTRCPLHQTRTQTVFARGNPEARLMIVGEAPGYYEDQQGLPFVGKAGSLLNKMIQSIGLNEDAVYIANVLKCRPPNNRDPQVAEIQQCKTYLAEQIAAVKPVLILGLGRFAGHFLTASNLALGKLRQQSYLYENTPVLISYHPAYLLRNPIDKKKAYEDWRKVPPYLSKLSPSSSASQLIKGALLPFMGVGLTTP